MATWKKHLPDYKWRLWDENSFDFSSVPFICEAYKLKKWAFVADYVRLYALYTEGGIYLDTDVKIMKSFDEFLEYNFFTSHEYHPGIFEQKSIQDVSDDGYPKNKDTFIHGLGVQAAIMGSISGLPYLQDCLNYYQTLHFSNKDGSYDCDKHIIGRYITKQIEKYGYRYKDETQCLCNNMKIFSSDVFVGNSMFLTKKSYAIHLCNGSWYDDNKKNVWWKMRNNYPGIYPILGLLLKVINKIKRMVE
jgi:hypothetical protein